MFIREKVAEFLILILLQPLLKWLPPARATAPSKTTPAGGTTQYDYF